MAIPRSGASSVSSSSNMRAPTSITLETVGRNRGLSIAASAIGTVAKADKIGYLRKDGAALVGIAEPRFSEIVSR